LLDVNCHDVQGDLHSLVVVMRLLQTVRALASLLQPRLVATADALSRRAEQLGVQDALLGRLEDAHTDACWHYVDANGRQVGPLTKAGLKVAFDAGLCREGSSVWEPAATGGWFRIQDVPSLQAWLQDPSGTLFSRADTPFNSARFQFNFEFESNI
jgi:hypothetical protein